MKKFLLIVWSLSLLHSGLAAQDFTFVENPVERSTAGTPVKVDMTWPTFDVKTSLIIYPHRCIRSTGNL